MSDIMKYIGDSAHVRTAPPEDTEAALRLLDDMRQDISYAKISEGHPMHPMLAANRAAGRWMCDSEDHNAETGCSNPKCFKHPNPAPVIRFADTCPKCGRGAAGDVSRMGTASHIRNLMCQCGHTWKIMSHLKRSDTL